LEFNEDPFKDANHRYGDPFDLDDPDDPFKNEPDPFTAPVTAAFGASCSTTNLTSIVSGVPKIDPFGGSAWNNSAGSSVDPFGTSSHYSATTSGFPPISNNLDDSFDPFSAKHLSKTTTEPSAQQQQKGYDPFGGGSVQQGNSQNFDGNTQKFGGIGGKSGSNFKKTRTESSVDPFGSSSAWNSSDPFSGVPVARSKTSSDAFADLRLASKSASVSRHQAPAPNKSLTPLSKSETFASGGLNSRPRNRPAASSAANAAAASNNLDSATDQQLKKKSGIKFLAPFMKNKDKSSQKVIKNDLSASAPQQQPILSDNSLKKVAESSRRTEDDRLRKLRLQEEKDLAYAIALSKAEAAGHH
jgi:hypothetical protein